MNNTQVRSSDGYTPTPIINPRPPKRAAAVLAEHTLHVMGNISSPEKRQQRPRRYVPVNNLILPEGLGLPEQINHLQQQHALVQEEVDILQEQIAQDDAGMHLDDEGMHQDDADIQQQLQNTINQLELAQAHAAQFQEQIAILQQQLTGQQIQQLQAPRTQLQHQLQELKTQRQAVLDQLNLLPRNDSIGVDLKRKRLELMQEQITTLETAFQSLQANLPGEEATQQQVLEGLQGQQAAFEKVSDRFAALKERLQDLGDQITDLANLPQQRTWGQTLATVARAALPIVFTGIGILYGSQQQYNAPLGGFGE